MNFSRCSTTCISFHGTAEACRYEPSRSPGVYLSAVTHVVSAVTPQLHLTSDPLTDDYRLEKGVTHLATTVTEVTKCYPCRDMILLPI
jgi:hypothetical protein